MEVEPCMHNDLMEQPLMDHDQLEKVRQLLEIPNFGKQPSGPLAPICLIMQPPIY